MKNLGCILDTDSTVLLILHILFTFYTFLSSQMSWIYDVSWLLQKRAWKWNFRGRLGVSVISIPCRFLVTTWSACGRDYGRSRRKLLMSWPRGVAEVNGKHLAHTAGWCRGRLQTARRRHRLGWTAARRTRSRPAAARVATATAHEPAQTAAAVCRTSVQQRGTSGRVVGHQEVQRRRHLHPGRILHPGVVVKR